MTMPLNLRKYVIMGVSGSASLKMISVGLAFINTLLLARVMNISDFGAYQFALSFISIFVLLAVFGIDKVFLRKIAYYRAKNENRLITGLMRRGQEIVLGFSLLFICVAAVLPMPPRVCIQHQ